MPTFRVIHRSMAGAAIIGKVADQWGYLGNMAPCPIDVSGTRWPTSEHLFQALRLPKDSAVRELIRAEKSPMGAKMLAKKHAAERVVEPMSHVDVAQMYAVLLLKLQQHPHILQLLWATEDLPIVEDCSKRPSTSGLFWGAVPIGAHWKGSNMLGQLWMALRREHSDGRTRRLL